MKVCCILILLALRVDRVFSGIFEDKLPDVIPTVSEWGWRDLKVTLMKRYQFEGVDYEALPTLPPDEFKLFKKSEGNKFHDHDCIEEMDRCILMLPYAFETCVFIPRQHAYLNFFSPCQADYVNCDYRQNHWDYREWHWGYGEVPPPLHGTGPGGSYYQLPLMFEGFGNWCVNSRRVMTLITEEDIEFEKDLQPLIKRNKNKKANRTDEVSIGPAVDSNV